MDLVIGGVIGVLCMASVGLWLRVAWQIREIARAGSRAGYAKGVVKGLALADELDARETNRCPPSEDWEKSAIHDVLRSDGRDHPWAAGDEP